MLHNLKIICYDLQSEKQTRDALHNMTWDTAARSPRPAAVRGGINPHGMERLVAKKFSFPFIKTAQNLCLQFSA